MWVWAWHLAISTEMYSPIILLLLDWKTRDPAVVGRFLQWLPAKHLLIHTHDTNTQQHQWLTRNILSSWSWMSFIPGKAATPWIISMKMQPTPLVERMTHYKTSHSILAQLNRKTNNLFNSIITKYSQLLRFVLMWFRFAAEKIIVSWLQSMKNTTEIL